jgi:hypothetical protein
MLLKLLTVLLSSTALVVAAPAGEEATVDTEAAKTKGYDYVRNCPGWNALALLSSANALGFLHPRSSWEAARQAWHSPPG